MGFPRLTLGGAVAGVLAVGTVQADEWSATPRVSAGVEHDSNKTLVIRDPISASGVIVDAAVALGWATETSNLVLTPRVRWGRYNEEPDLLDHTDFYLDLASSGSTERARYGLNGNLTLDSVDTSQTIAEEEGLRRLRRENVDRNRRNLAPSWSYILTERDTASLSGSFTWVDYDESDLLQGGYVDYRYHVLNASLAHAFTERDTVSLIGYYSRYSRDLFDAVTDSVGMQVGYEHQFSETLKGSVAAGAVRSDFSSDADDLLDSGDDTEYGQLINASLSQRLERDQWTLSAGRTLSPTGDGVLVRRDEVRGDYWRQLTERLTGHIGGLLYHDESPTKAGGILRPDRTYGRVELGLAYQLSPYWTLRGQYRYRFEEYDLLGGGDDRADSDSFLISIAWQGEKYATAR